MVLLADEKLYSSELLFAWPFSSTSEPGSGSCSLWSYPWVASVGIVFPLLPQFFSSCLSVSASFPTHSSQSSFPAAAFLFLGFKRAGESQLRALKISTVETLGLRSSSNTSAESWVCASRTLPRLLHLYLGSFSMSFLISCPGNAILFHFLAFHPLCTSHIHLGVLWVEEIPGGCLFNLLVKTVVLWGPYPFSTWKIFKYLDPQTASLRKNVSLFSGLFECLGPTWAASLAVFPALFFLVMAVPCSPPCFWVGISSSGSASWFADHCWTRAVQGSTSSQYAQKCSGCALGGVCLGVFKSPKLLGKKANTWCMNITHHSVLVFSSRP